MKPPISVRILLIVEQTSSKIELECEFLWEDGSTVMKRVPAHRPVQIEFAELELLRNPPQAAE